MKISLLCTDTALNDWVLALSIQSKTWSSFLSSLAELAQKIKFFKKLYCEVILWKGTPGNLYYIKQTQSCAIFEPTLIWHLLHKINPKLSYFEISYVFWEHNYSVGRGTTVLKINSWTKMFTFGLFLNQIKKIYKNWGVSRKVWL